VVDAQARVAQVIVPDYQLSLAIGKEGQNVRLAARLTGWRIDIRPDSDADEAVASAAPEDASQAGQGGEGADGDGALASAVSDAPGAAGTVPGAVTDT